MLPFRPVPSPGYLTPIYCGSVTVTADVCCNVPEVPVTVTTTALAVGVVGEDEDCVWLMPPPPQPTCAITRSNTSARSSAICHFLRRPTKTTPKTGSVANHSASCAGMEREGARPTVETAVTVRVAVAPEAPGGMLGDDSEQVTAVDGDEHARLTGAAKAPYCGTSETVNMVDWPRVSATDAADDDKVTADEVLTFGVSDANGVFRTEDAIPRGQYSVIVIAGGFRPIISDEGITIPLNAKGTYTVNATMRPSQ